MQSIKTQNLSALCAGLAALLFATLSFESAVHAQQRFTASIDGVAWGSDNAGINVIPVALGTSGGTVTITS